MERPTRTTWRSPFAIRRRIVLVETRRTAAASETLISGAMGIGLAPSVPQSGQPQWRWMRLRRISSLAIQRPRRDSAHDGRRRSFDKIRARPHHRSGSRLLPCAPVWRPGVQRPLSVERRSPEVAINRRVWSVYACGRPVLWSAWSIFHALRATSDNSFRNSQNRRRFSGGFGITARACPPLLQLLSDSDCHPSTGAAFMAQLLPATLKHCAPKAEVVTPALRQRRRALTLCSDSLAMTHSWRVG